MSSRILHEQQAAWERKPSLRALYQGWFEDISRRMASVPGRNLEVGAGIGQLKKAIPGLKGLDIEATPWTDLVGDAQQLPVRDGSLANIVCFDVLHHIPRPALFFRQAARALAPGGRVLVMDPYVSPVSFLVYRFFHPEGVSMACDPYDEASDVCSDTPFDSNQAVATRMFFADGHRFERSFPGLRVTERRRLAMLAYPATGGFGGRTLLPGAAIRLLDRVERLVPFLVPLLAFRALVVVERHA